MADLSLTDDLTHTQYKEEWQGTTVIDVYDTALYIGAEIFGRIDNATDAEMVRIALVNYGTDVGLDIRQIGVDNNYLNLVISAAVSNGIAQLTIQNTEGGENNTLEYSVHRLTI